MATRYYGTTYSSNTDRSFDTSYIAAHSHDPILFYLSGPGSYQKAYSKQYEGFFLGLRTHTFEGQYTKTWVGEWEGQYEGGPYDTNWQSTWSRVYESQWTQAYSGQYQGQINWEGTFTPSPNQWSTTYQRVYLQTYEGNYARDYQGDYSQIYADSWTSNWVTGYVHNVDVDYTKLYATQWSVGWTKNYAQQYQDSYEGQYTGNYQTQWQKAYTNNWNQDYTDQYEGLYQNTWTRIYQNTWTKTYSNQWVSPDTDTVNYVSPDTDTVNYVQSNDVNYVSPDENVTYTKQWQSSFEKLYSNTWSRQYTNQWTGTYQKLWEGQYTRAYIDIHDDTGTYSSTWSSPGWASQQGNMLYVDPQLEDEWVGPRYITYTGYYTSSWVGAAVSWSRNWIKQWEGVTTYFIGPYYQGTLGLNFEPGGVVNLPGDAFEDWAGNYQGNIPAPKNYTVGIFGFIGSFVPTTFQTFSKTYDSQVTAQYSGIYAAPTTYDSFTSSDTVNYAHETALSYTRLYQNTWTKTYSNTWQRLYTNTWQRLYQNTWESLDNVNYVSPITDAVNYISEDTVNYDQIWTKAWSSPEKTVNYLSPDDLVQYTGSYTQQWTGTWSGIWVSQYTSDSQWTGSWVKTYEATWSKEYSKPYISEWSQTWSTLWQRVYAGDYATTFTWAKIYTKTYLGGPYSGIRQWTGTFEGTYNKQYTKSWVKAYTGLYVGPQWYAYEGRTIGQFSGVFVGYYDKQYTGYFAKQFEGSFQKQFTKIYSKVYEGAFAGNLGVSYAGLNLYTKSWTGQLQYQMSYEGTTSYLGLHTGDINETEKTAVKDSSGNWKETKEIFVRKDSSWAQLKSAFIRTGDSWKLVHVGWERTDFEITSDTEYFYLYNRLIDAGKSPGSRPQLVNIYISGADVFSTQSTVAALDLSTNMGTIGFGDTSVKHLVRVVVLGDAKIIGAAGSPGAQSTITRTGSNGGNGGHAILTGGAIELFVENYGTIAGGGGGGGSGGYPVKNSTALLVGGQGGWGAGYKLDSGYMFMGDGHVDLAGSGSPVLLGIDGGNGGNLGQRGSAAGGYEDTAGNVVANDGSFKTLYHQSGDGGYPGSAIKGYAASRVTFINTGNVFGDSKYKLLA